MGTYTEAQHWKKALEGDYGPLTKTWTKHELAVLETHLRATIDPLYMELGAYKLYSSLDEGCIAYIYACKRGSTGLARIASITVALYIDTPLLLVNCPWSSSIANEIVRYRLERGI